MHKSELFITGKVGVDRKFNIENLTIGEFDLIRRALINVTYTQAYIDMAQEMLRRFEQNVYIENEVKEK